MNPNFKGRTILHKLNGDITERREMTTSNLNQFVKRKINIDPQLLSKNTNQIVSTCIKKFYEQIPEQYRHGLQQIKAASARMENKAPIRMFKEETERELQQQKAKRLSSSSKKYMASNVDESHLLHSIMKVSRKRLLTNQTPEGSKKLLKPPTYKIYQQRRFGSSASSSSSRSVFRRQEPTAPVGHNKSRLSSHALRQLKKSFTMIHGGGGAAAKKSNTAINPKVFASLVQPSKKKSCHMFKGLSTKPKPLQMESNVENNLMAIEEILGKRMNLSKKNPIGKPLKPSMVWDYPPTPQLSHCRNEQNFANRVLQQQCKHLQLALQEKLSSNEQPEQHPPLPCQLPYRESLKRQRYTNPVVIKRETVRTNSISPNQRQVYVKRKPLSELQRPQIPELWSRNNANARSFNANGKENVFHVRGLPAMVGNAAMRSSFSQRNQNNRYAKLAANVH
ncbi:uncharacterized protein LOC131807060 [Musca domestica]|uniref:Uncharacterized protein LOC131807060 n=1 Tax=Musca domestica TaxID=7370 RepID=A0ABM3VQI3_MUSDO|nr:uncharacterized protein LOC131807060 [Musca domestica]